MINKGDKAVCVLCSGTVVCRTSSVKRHFETNHKSFCEKSEPEQKELIASAIKDRNKQSTSIFKYVSKNCHTSAASYSAANAIARHANGWTEEIKACQLVASLRGEAAEILQTLPDTERLNLNSLYNTLGLRFDQKYFKDYARLQMQRRLQKTGENEEIQRAVRMADVQDLKSAPLFALKFEVVAQASCNLNRGSKVTADVPSESPWLKEIEKLRKQIQSFMAQRQNRRRSRIAC
ncbi:uncharacterized protein TNCV_3020471 [Trichonephila clavipes]|nr:uncharacterized protein TNCV_3020471 [Trichonephila clavipes]